MCEEADWYEKNDERIGGKGVHLLRWNDVCVGDYGVVLYLMVEAKVRMWKG